MSFPLFKFKERRFHQRKRLTGLLPGKMQDDKGNNFACRPVDISHSGLGIVSTHFLDIGSNIFLIIKNEQIILRVLWKQPDFGRRDLFRYGLVCENPDIDLEEIFILYGCLK